MSWNLHEGIDEMVIPAVTREAALKALFLCVCVRMRECVFCGMTHERQNKSA
jgi:hypothetical protein